jgi:hypothetical protein
VTPPALNNAQAHATPHDHHAVTAIGTHNGKLVHQSNIQIPTHEVVTLTELEHNQDDQYVRTHQT